MTSPSIAVQPTWWAFGTTTLCTRGDTASMMPRYYSARDEFHCGLSARKKPETPHRL
ncbi:MAG: hypothetical protein ABW003_09840 [Microvirga sp.]